MSDPASPVPGIGGGLLAVIRRDLLLAWKRPGDILNPLFFFAMVATLFPLGTGPSAEQLQFSGPGVLWVAALLAMMILSPRMQSWAMCTQAMIQLLLPIQVAPPP